MASNSLISVTNNMLFDLNGRKNKSILGLFDNDLDTKMNLNITNEDAFILPYHSFVVLPNIYNNFRIDYYDRFGSGPVLTIKLYSSTKTLLGTFSLTTELFNAWKTVSGTDGFSDVRFLEVTADDNFNFEAGIYEVKLYGDVVTAAAPIFPSATINPVPDLGKHAHSVNILDDRFKRKDGPSGNGENILLKIAGSTRIGFEATKWDYYPNHFTNPSDGLIWLGRNGSDNLARRVKDVAGPNDIEVQMYRIGGSLKDLPEGVASNNTAYIQDVNNLFRITPGGDKETEAAWQPLADLFYKLVALYGNNPAADMTGITVTGATGADAQPGQNIFQYFEIGNEDDKDWLGGTSFLSPRARLAKIRKVAARMKQADPNCKPMVDAATFMNNTYFRAMGFINYWDHDNAELPIYGFNFNGYLNSDLDGQGGSGVGVSPEVWNLKNRLVEFKSQMDEMFPNKVVFWSEFGTAADPASPWYIAAVGSKTARQVCADIALRIEAICQSVRFVPKMNYYTFFEDGSWPFNSMAITHDVFNDDPIDTYYIRTEVYPIGYALANKYFLEKDYNWFADELIYGGTTGKHVRRKSHATDSNKKLFKIWMGTNNGSTLTNEPLDIGSNAVSATLYSLRYDQWTPSSLSLSITGSTVTIPIVEEGMKWVEVTYSSPSTPLDMSTIAALKASNNSVIRTETTSAGITVDEVADILDNIVDEVWVRGIITVANTAALATLSGDDFRQAIVKDNGVYQWASSGTPNGVDIFAAPVSGVWIRSVRHFDGSGGSLTDGNKGDITVSGTGASWAVNSGAITLAKMADIATARFIGRTTAGTGVPEALTATQATALLDAFTSGAKGLVPASGGGTTNFLRADGTWAAPPGGGGGVSGLTASRISFAASGTTLSDDATFFFNTTTKEVTVKKLIITNNDGEATPNGAIVFNGSFTGGTEAGHAIVNQRIYSRTTGAIAFIDDGGSTTVSTDHSITLQSRPTHTGGTLTTLHGTGIYPTVSGTGVVTNIWNHTSRSAVNNGTTTENVAYNVENPTLAGSGAITNNYGLKVANLTAGTNNYSIFTGTAQSYFGGTVRVVAGELIMNDLAGTNNVPFTLGNTGNNTYPSINYNAGLRTNSGKFLVADIALKLDINATGFVFRGSNTGSAGATITFTDLITIPIGNAATMGNLIVHNGQVQINSNTPAYVGAKSSSDYPEFTYNYDLRGNVYKIADEAYRFRLDNGFQFITAAAGSAGAAPSWTERARITDTGILMVNRTTDDSTGAKIQVGGSVSTDAADATRVAWLFGEAITGSSGITINATAYIKVKINGTLYNLAIAQLP